MRGQMVNGYWIHKIKATFGDTAHWRVTKPDGTMIGRYPTSTAARQAARKHLPPDDTKHQAN